MKNVNRQIIDIYWQHTRKYKKQLSKIYPLIAIAQMFEDFLVPLLISSVLNKIASNDLDALNNKRIWLIISGVLLFEILAHILWNIIIRIFWRTQERVMYDLHMSVFNHLQKMSYRFYSDRFAGSLVSQTNRFVSSFERLTDPLTWNVFKLLISLSLTVIILSPKAPIVAVTILLITFIYIPTVWAVKRNQVKFTERWAEAETMRTGQLADAISNILVVKSFSNERHEVKRMDDRAKTVFDRSIDTMQNNMRQELTTGFIQRSINISVIILCIILAARGLIEVGIIYLALTYTLGIMRRLWDLNGTFRAFTRVFGDASDMAKILQIEPEVADPINPVEFLIKDGQVSFDKVTFKYSESSENDTLFSSIDINIKPGEKIGLIGPSGSGKTTITKLLLRFMDIQSGTIKIDDQDISKITQSDLRAAISYVPQEPLLFHRSISENIAYGKKGATNDEIRKAANRSNSTLFIDNLAEGYDTLVGERGVKLSGGQKQRIAIARAMLKDAPILVLDEATSALDSESEKLIQDALWKLMSGKTAIVIAHRLSTIQKMDRILVLDKGMIVEQGNHTQLLAKKDGLYAKLWQHQSGGFLQD